MSSSVSRPSLLSSTGGLVSGGLLGRHHEPAVRRVSPSRSAAQHDAGPAAPNGSGTSNLTVSARAGDHVSSEVWASGSVDVYVLSLGAAKSG